MSHGPMSRRESEPPAPIGWIREVVLDARDPAALAVFWCGLLGGQPVEWYDGWVTLEPPPNGLRLSFQKTARAETSGSTVHFDVLVDDLETGHRRVLAAGAQFVGEHWSPRPDERGNAVRWRVYRDPAGHAFCLVLR
jgi:hypothetical protein